MADTHCTTLKLWEEFHRVVNMSSRELADCLRTCSASVDVEQLPDQAGTPTGQHVLHILSRRRTDLTPDDLQVMRTVVRRGDRESDAGQPGRRHRLMSLGHDPLKPA
jgi:Protein of unknown function (DUF3140)